MSSRPPSKLHTPPLPRRVTQSRGVEEGGVPNAKTLHPFSLAVALKVRGMANSILCASLFFPLQ